MDHNDVKHKHNKNDIIIKDQDGTYKMLVDGKFVPLDDVEALAHAKADEAKAKNQPSPFTMEQKSEISTDTRRAEEIVKKSGVSFASRELRERAVKALETHLKGVRKPFETKELLMKSPAEGGIGLDDSDVKKIMDAAGIQQTQEIKPVSSPPLPPSKPIMPAMPVGQEVHQPSQMQVKMPEMPPEPKNASVTPMTPTKAPVASVVDVSKPSRPTVGLAAELAYSLADWRRLAPNPKDRIKKIENQIGVLEEESFSHKVKGLNAWRQSDIMKMYVDAGSKSLETGKALRDLLGDGGPDSLSLDEWEAVADLNTRLRG